MPSRTSLAPPPRRVLWVEGNDDNGVVQSLCAAHDVPERFSIQSKQGIERLLSGIGVELVNPVIESFGVVVDANGDAHARWSRIRRSLEGAGYAELPATPDAGGIVVPATQRLPRFGAWIMPDNGSSGALEDFAAALVPAGDALWVRAGAAVDAIPQDERRFPPVRRSKAHVHTFLAWQEHPGSPMGQAIGKGDLDAQAPAARRFVTWLHRLMVDDAPAAPT